MPDTLTEIRKRVESEYEAEGEGAWPEECFVDARALLSHIDTLTAAVKGLPERLAVWDETWTGPVVSRAAVLAILRGEQ